MMGVHVFFLGQVIQGGISLLRGIEAIYKPTFELAHNSKNTLLNRQSLELHN